MKPLTFLYGTRQVSFRLERKDIRSLAITVQADGKVRVSAPLHANDEQVIARVKKRARWIAKQWERQAGYLPTPPRPSLNSGTSIRYLGRQYRVRVTTHTAGQDSVSLQRFILEVHVPDRKNEPAIQKQIHIWLRKRASTILPERYKRCLESVAKHRLPSPKMQVRAMPKRWGSCVRKDLILLNPELVRAPSSCIDYVILHEICHLKHPNHGPQFRALLERLCPDWKQLKDRLERIL